MEKARTDGSGRRWLFAYWYEGPRDNQVTYPQQLFFWNDERTESGVVLFSRDKTLRYSLIRNLMEKLIADPSLRGQHSGPLRFPVERHYKQDGFIVE